jgi:predicted ATP-grasp superfamily ATP-dependent carboligase
MEITGLAIARCLGRHNIQVIAIDSDYYKTGSLSKYCENMICPNPRKHESKFVNFLMKLGQELPTRAVLFPTNDEFVLSISKNSDLLAKHFIFPCLEDDIVHNINDKAQFYSLATKHGVDVPTVYFADDLHSLISMANQIRFPCIIKPKFGYLFKDFKIKAVKCYDKNELLDNFQNMRNISKHIVIQEHVIGKEDEQFSLCSYLNKDLEPYAVFITRKVRQRPKEFGLGTLVESCYIPEIQKLGLSFLKSLNYWGISEVEFKKDGRDGKFKLLEINTRPWNQIGLASRCGINIPFIAYNDLLGRYVEKNYSFRTNVKWLWFGSDIYTTFGKSGYISKQELTFREWFNSIRGEKDYALFAFDDPKPFIGSCLKGLRQLLRKCRKSNAS